MHFASARIPACHIVVCKIAFKVLFGLAALLLPQAEAQSTSEDSIIPASRRIDWAPGRQSAIPSVSVCANVRQAPYGAKGDGTTDDTVSVQNAINSSACANGGAVYLPAGQYKLSSPIVISRSGIVVRGDGSNQTIILGYANGSNESQFRFSGGGASVFPATSGYSKDSRTLTLSTAASFAATGGDYLQIEQDNDPAIIEGNIPGATIPYQVQVIPVSSRSGNTLTLGRPLYYSYSSGRNVRARQLYNVVQNCGIENLKIDMRGSADDNILFFRAAKCWVRNVESYNANWHHIGFSQAYGCQINHNYFHHAHTYGQGGYGIDLADGSTDNLIDNNVFYYLRHSMVIQNGATGNVVAYNYSSRGFDVSYPNTDYLMSDLEFHGGHPNMNLFEGNMGMEMIADNYWGSSRHNTFFRNYASRYSLGENRVVKYGLWAARIDEDNLYYNIVGNILARPGDSGIVWLIGRSSDPVFNGSHIDPAHPIDDPRVESTMIKHGNVNRIDGSIQWDPSITSHTLRSSYYLSSKPAFFGTMNWPTIGPDVAGWVQPIPAQLCFENYWLTGQGPCPELPAPPPPGSPSAPKNLQIGQ